MYHTKIKKINHNKKISFLVLAFIAILVTVVGLLFYRSSNRNDQHLGETATDKINLQPPTISEQEQANIQKDEISKREEKIKANSPKSGAKKQVFPQITFAEDYGDKIEIAGITSGIFESNGICKATLRQGNLSFSKQESATPSGSTVSCPVISIPQSDFPAVGAWTVTLSYSSPTSEGNSSLMEIVVN